MFKRIQKYKRYKDFYAINSFEVRFSLFFTILFGIVLFHFFHFYDNFFLYINSVKDLLLNIIAGDFGLLGMSLAGMAIITSLFTPDILKVIKQVDKNDTVNRVLSSFEFSALNIILQIIYLIMIFFALSSECPKIGKIFLKLFFF